MPKRALLLVNRKSRSGDGDLDAAIERLERCGIELVEQQLEQPQQIPELIHRYRHQVDCVIVGGGDGSMNAAAPALLDTRLPLGVLPMGTANDLARTLCIPTGLEQAAAIIGDGMLHAIDLARVNNRYFFNVANIGLGVDVAHNLSSGMKQRWGVLSYARSLLKAIRSSRPFHADIVCDGRQLRVRSIQIAVGNGRYYGGGMTVAAQASIDDNMLFLYSIEPLRWWEMLRLMPALRAGRFEQRHPVDIAHGKTVTVTTRRAMVVTADGEAVTRTPAGFSMLPGAISVFVPASYFAERQELRRVAQR